jgi:hypothetical protein
MAGGRVMADLERRMFAKPHYGVIEFSICVIGRLGGVQFHFTVDSREELRHFCDTHPYHPFGVEGHRRVSKDKANHEYCQLINGPCKHDGTSLYASETVMPAFLRGGSDAVYPLLESCYRNWFEQEAA